ncbi:MAG: iron ABC transporter permease [Cypionkella sp.]|nr:iron ABC transporter permease [Cypionkella sp.]
MDAAQRPPRRIAPSGWMIAAIVVVALVLSPLISIVVLSLGSLEPIWAHMLQTVLPRYFFATLRMMLVVGLLAAAIGAGAAWLVTLYRFWGSRALSVLLLFPLAIPAYVGAYALVDVLDYAGWLQTWMRAAFGWRDARDYWFFEIRSEWAAALVLGFALYPYVYILVRSALREQAGGALEVGRALGLGPLALFWRLGLPMLRPALAAGTALVMMETVADFGTMQHFGVQTLTTAVFSTWFGQGNVGGAAQIALLILTLIALLYGFETVSRKGARFYGQSRSMRPIVQRRLTGWRAGLAFAVAGMPFAIGFVLPVAVMLGLSLSAPSVWAKPGLLDAALNTAAVGGLAALITVAAAVVLVFGLRMGRSGVLRAVLPVTALGYAAPGAVLALGLLIPLAAFDHLLADTVLAATGFDPGLLITGTSAAIILAYALRFFGIAQGAVDSAFGRLSPNLPHAARSLGRTPWGALTSVHMPIMRGSIAAALLVIFVDCVKELPATLMLRPFNFNTLSTRVYELASREHLSEAAPAALIVMTMGLTATLLLARSLRE